MLNEDWLIDLMVENMSDAFEQVDRFEYLHEIPREEF